MPLTEYGIQHPDLDAERADPARFRLRRDAEAIVAAWPGARLVSRTQYPYRGVHGSRYVWTTWSPVDRSPVDPPSSTQLAIDLPALGDG